MQSHLKKKYDDLNISIKMTLKKKFGPSLYQRLRIKHLFPLTFHSIAQNKRDRWSNYAKDPVYVIKSLQFYSL